MGAKNLIPKFILILSEPEDGGIDIRITMHEPYSRIRAKSSGSACEENTPEHDLLLKQGPICGFFQ